MWTKREPELQGQRSMSNAFSLLFLAKPWSQGVDFEMYADNQ